MAWTVNGYFIDGSTIDMSGRPLVAGEVLLAGYVSDSTSTTGVGPGTGWTQIGTNVVTTLDAQTMAVWKKDTAAAGGETSLFMTTSTAALCFLLAVGGADAGTHYDVTPPTPTSDNSSTASPASISLGITPVTNGSLLIAFKGSDVTVNLDAAHTFSDTGGLSWTTRIDGQGGFRNVGVGTAEQTTAAATTVSGTSTFASGNAAQALFVVALRNASPPAGGSTELPPLTMPPMTPPMRGAR